MSLINTLRPGGRGGWLHGREGGKEGGICSNTWFLQKTPRPPLPSKNEILSFQIWSVIYQAPPFVVDSLVLIQI